jgi:Trk K+ transport system NAD-binding subunit
MQMKTMQELDLRRNYGVTVVAINRRSENGEREVIIPDQAATLKVGDKLVVMGRVEDLKRLKDNFDSAS